MNDRSRADLGFADALDGLDLTDFTPAPAARPKPEPALARAVAAQTGFQSREAGQGRAQAHKPAPEAAQPVRRRRTGRNAQFNLKAKPETINAFCAVADANGWGLGETLEYAVSLLEREYQR
jgi:hypothetical protein